MMGKPQINNSNSELQKRSCKTCFIRALPSASSLRDCGKCTGRLRGFGKEGFVKPCIQNRYKPGIIMLMLLTKRGTYPTYPGYHSDHEYGLLPLFLFASSLPTCSVRIHLT